MTTDLSDPRGAHVTFNYAKRHYIGEVKDWYRDETTDGTVRLIVHHFNGERWMDPNYTDRPLNPPMRSVEFLEREWE